MIALIKKLFLVLIPKFVKDELLKKEIGPFLEDQIDAIMLSPSQRQRHKELMDLAAKAKTDEDRRKYVAKLRKQVMDS